MSIKTVVLASICCLATGCGGTWFPQSSHSDKAAQPLSGQIYHQVNYARKQHCQVKAANADQIMRTALYNQCMRYSGRYDY